VTISANFVYVAVASGLQVIDVSDPTNPRQVGANRTISPVAVTVANGKVFAASGTGGLFILHLHRYARFESVSLQQGDLSLTFSGPPGTPGTLQRSGDLRNWESLLPITFPEGFTNVFVPNVLSQPVQFYRTVVP
jgi:hypothetical protein